MFYFIRTIISTINIFIVYILYILFFNESYIIFKIPILEKLERDLYSDISLYHKV